MSLFTQYLRVYISVNLLLTFDRIQGLNMQNNIPFELSKIPKLNACVWSKVEKAQVMER